MTIGQYEELLLKNVGAMGIDFKIDGREVIAMAQAELSDAIRQLIGIGKQVPASFYLKVEGRATNGKAKLPICNVGRESIFAIKADEKIEIVSGQDEFENFKDFAENHLGYVSGGFLHTTYSGDFEASIYPDLLQILESNPETEMIGQEFLSIVTMKVKNNFATKLAIPEDKTND
jgi:hypothetical protein